MRDMDEVTGSGVGGTGPAGSKLDAGGAFDNVHGGVVIAVVVPAGCDPRLGADQRRSMAMACSRTFPGIGSAARRPSGRTQVISLVSLIGPLPFAVVRAQAVLLAPLAVEATLDCGVEAPTRWSDEPNAQSCRRERDANRRSRARPNRCSDAEIGRYAQTGNAGGHVGQPLRADQTSVQWPCGRCGSRLSTTGRPGVIKIVLHGRVRYGGWVEGSDAERPGRGRVVLRPQQRRVRSLEKIGGSRELELDRCRSGRTSTLRGSMRAPATSSRTTGTTAAWQRQSCTPGWRAAARQ